MNGRVILMILLLMAGASTANASDELLSVTGRIKYPAAGRIYLFLVDQESFKVPLSGLQTIVLEADKGGSAGFSFDGLPKGVYGIRAYQDTNGNGRLDRGMFGPSEPWGMSWNSERSFRWPKFSHISFVVEESDPVVEIELK